MISLENIEKTFGPYRALAGIDLTIGEGEFLALLGPSGSGKTTLLRIIAGLAFPDSGRVLFDGADVTGLTVAQRKVGFVFQHYALFKHMTVADNVGFGLSVRPRRDRPAKRAIRARAEELLELVHLPGLADRYPDQLSGGQRQRVALARALAVEPRLLLLDEPFGALDAKVRKDLRRWLRELHEETGLTTIFVTHDQEEALELADRVVVMNQGRIEQAGTPEAIYTAPGSRFVSAFVGDTNGLPVTVERGAVHIAGRRLDLGPVEVADGPWRLDFRPHDTRVVGDDSGALPVEVRAVYRRAGHWRIEGTTAGFDKMVELDLAATQEPPRIGQTIAIRIENFRFFPIEERTA